jgi:hypothetical protein
MRRTRRGASPPRRSGDDVGPQGIPAPAILDTTTQRFRFYLIALGLLVAFYLLYRRFVDSPRGRVCAVEFLAWLREEDIPLAGARQGDLERWLATGTSTRRRIGPFLAWMAETRIGPRLSLPVTALGTGPRITQGERVELITRLFHDASVDLDTRVAGLFLLLFAQPVARTARLRVDDVKRHLEGWSRLRSATNPRPCPAPSTVSPASNSTAPMPPAACGYCQATSLATTSPPTPSLPSCATSASSSEPARTAPLMLWSASYPPPSPPTPPATAQQRPSVTARPPAFPGPPTRDGDDHEAAS